MPAKSQMGAEFLSCLPTDYEAFLRRKVTTVKDSGFHVQESRLNEALFPFQKAIVTWSLKIGRSAMFEDCGLGKTLQQLEWAHCVVRHTGGKVLILAPLSVSQQTIREGRKFGIEVNYSNRQENVKAGITVTNYESLKSFDASEFAGVVLDESSILKNYTGKTKTALVEAFAHCQYKLCCSATPAPNDYMEIGNQSEFLGIMDSNEMLSRWFINDSMNFGNYRLKGHAVDSFWKWVASWAACVSKPSDLGFSDDGFILHPLNIQSIVVPVDYAERQIETLLPMEPLTATTLHKEMRLTSPTRSDSVAAMVNASTEPWLVWCNTNYEADDLAKRIPDAVEVRGSEKLEAKESKIESFALGRARVLISKPSICGLGMNFQHCRNVAFVGLSYSYEDLYQAIRRSYRFGQTQAVNVYIVTAETEGSIVATIQKKMDAHVHMQQQMFAASRELLTTKRLELKMDYDSKVATGDGWEMRLGDSVELSRLMGDNSVDFGIHSPPFSNLYIYSDSVRDMGNCADDEEFFDQYRFLIREMYRITRPGRLCVVHCKDLPSYKGREGAAGLHDFPGKIIRTYEEEGWKFHSRVTIWKDPVIEMQRTKNHGLLYKILCTDSSASRQGMADYLIVFRKFPKKGDEVIPVTMNGERFTSYSGYEPPDAGYIANGNNIQSPPMIEGKWPHFNPFPVGTQAHREWSIMVWQKYASPVWMDINQTDVLNGAIARDDADEKHICPLQLGVIERAVCLWSNPGDLVYSPFAGIGSEGYVSIKQERRFIGHELKEAYFKKAIGNLESLKFRNRSLFFLFGD
jgi:DNA modification methylase